MRVLVADDHLSVRVLLATMLQEAGHEVVAAVGDGRQAFLRTRELTPDVVVLDLGMPDIDGIAALRLLRAADPLVRIVVFTGFDDTELEGELTAAGADAVVIKGGEPEALLDALAELARAA